MTSITTRPLKALTHHLLIKYVSNQNKLVGTQFWMSSLECCGSSDCCNLKYIGQLRYCEVRQLRYCEVSRVPGTCNTVYDCCYYLYRTRCWSVIQILIWSITTEVLNKVNIHPTVFKNRYSSRKRSGYFWSRRNRMRSLISILSIGHKVLAMYMVTVHLKSCDTDSYPIKIDKCCTQSMSGYRTILLNRLSSKSTVNMW
jgi:hypothetical protein